jgi:hypothetical protein
MVRLKRVATRPCTAGKKLQTMRQRPTKGGDVGLLGMCACAPEENPRNLNQLRRRNIGQLKR